MHGMDTVCGDDALQTTPDIFIKKITVWIKFWITLKSILFRFLFASSNEILQKAL